MKREIKFRAWDKEMRLVSPVGRIDFGKSALIYQPVQQDEDGNIDWTGADVPIERLELMQFTGLKDKNGKEIYEGDVLEVVFPPDEFMPKEQQHPFIYRGQVIFKPGQFEIEDEKGDFIDLIGNNEFPPEGDEKTLEIIGNIYENPELIK